MDQSSFFGAAYTKKCVVSSLSSTGVILVNEGFWNFLILKCSDMFHFQFKAFFFSTFKRALSRLFFPFLNVLFRPTLFSFFTSSENPMPFLEVCLLLLAHIQTIVVYLPLLQFPSK